MGKHFSLRTNTYEVFVCEHPEGKFSVMKVGLGNGLAAGMMVAKADEKDAAIEMTKRFPEYHEIASQRGYVLTKDQTGEAIYSKGATASPIYTHVVLGLPLDKFKEFLD